MVSDRRTRQLLTTYAKKGVGTVEMVELKQLVDCHAPYLTALIQHVEKVLPGEIHTVSVPVIGRIFYNVFLAHHQLVP